MSNMRTGPTEGAMPAEHKHVEPPSAGQKAESLLDAGLDRQLPFLS